MNSQRKYLIQHSVLWIIWVAIFVLLLICYPSVWSLLICLLLVFPYRLLLTLFFVKNFVSILSNERDAQKFYDAIHQKPMRSPLLYRLAAELYVGNYERLIGLSLVSYKRTRSIRKKCDYLTFLARAYFDLRDIDNLAKTICAFYQLQSENPKKRNLFLRYHIFQYYRAYVDGDFERCIFLAENRIEKIKTNHLTGKMQWLIQKSNCAVACYDYGDFVKAKEIFEYLLKTAPKLKNFNLLSTKYLEAIDNKDNTILASVVCKVDTTEYEQELKSFSKKNAKKKVLLWISIVLATVGVVLLALSTVFDYMGSKDNEKISLYESKLNDALVKQYGQTAKIAYFNVKKDGENIDSLCLVDNDDNLILVEVVSNNDGQTLTVLEIVKNTHFDTYYCNKSPASGYYIGFVISSNEPLTNSLYYLLDFQFNNSTYWFYIDYIETIPKY